jgi:hypothetical protein
MMRRIQIETAANGYIATEGSPGDVGVCACDPYVFETFDSLVKWLGQKLKKTESGNTVFDPTKHNP